MNAFVNAFGNAHSATWFLSLCRFLRLLDKLDFESMSFSLYFLASVAEDEKTPEPGTVEAHQYLWTFPGTTLDDSSVLLWCGLAHLVIAFAN